MRQTIAILVLALSVFAATSAWSATRLALVIGNSHYAVGPLTNPTNDAALMADTLTAVGFKVTHMENLGYREMQRAVVGFARDLRAAGEDAVGLVYYAGHAVQADGENYMIPVDADLQDALDLQIQTLEASTLMSSLDRAGNRLNMVVLDACRNNPFPAVSRSGSRGLAKIDAPHGTLLAYSTSPGDVAADGNGRNSPYTKALAKAIRTPGVPVEQLFKQVRIEVMEKTGNKQIPWESSSLTGDFFFLDKAPEPPPVAAAPAAAPSANAQAADIEFWKSIAASTDPSLFRGYMEAFPNGLFVGLAEQRITALESAAAAQSLAAEREKRQAEAAQAWDAVKDSGDPGQLQAVADAYPDTVYAKLAAAKIEGIRGAEAAAAQARSSAQPTQDNSDQLDLAFWGSIKNSTNKADYQAYLDRFPNGAFARLAEERARNGYTPQVASLPAASQQVFAGVMDQGSSCNYGGLAASGDFEGRIEVDGRNAQVAFYAGKTKRVSFSAKLTNGRFAAAKYIAGTYGSEPFSFSGKLTGDVFRFSVSRGSCEKYGELKPVAGG